MAAIIRVINHANETACTLHLLLHLLFHLHFNVMLIGLLSRDDNRVGRWNRGHGLVVRSIWGGEKTKLEWLRYVKHGFNFSFKLTVVPLLATYTALHIEIGHRSIWVSHSDTLVVGDLVINCHLSGWVILGEGRVICMYYILLWLVRLLLLLDGLRLWLLLWLAEDGDVVGGLRLASQMIVCLAFRHETTIEELMVLFSHGGLDVVRERCSGPSGVVSAPVTSLLELISSLRRAMIDHVAFVWVILLGATDLIQNICVDMWGWVHDNRVGLRWAHLMMLVLRVNTSWWCQVLNVICLNFLTGGISALHL